MKSFLRVCLLGTLLCLLAALAGCEMFSAEAWQRPSPLTSAPPPRPKPAAREIRGGFTVPVEVPGQPSAARVAADIGEFAKRRGFVPQRADPPTSRYVLGSIVLEVAFDSAHLLVRAYLHSPVSHGNRESIEAFYQDFHQEHAGQYGDQAVIAESDFADGAPIDSAASAGRGRRGGSAGGR